MDSAANQKGINQSCGEISNWTCTDDFLDLEYARWQEVEFDYRLTTQPKPLLKKSEPGVITEVHRRV